MLDAKETCFSEPLNIRPPLQTVAGGLDYSGAALTNLTVTGGANRFAYMLYLSAFCIVAGTTQGNWTLSDTSLSTFPNLRQPFDTPSPGQELCFPFPHPWKTGSKGDTFTIQGSVATMGTWRFIANGFLSAL